MHNYTGLNLVQINIFSKFGIFGQGDVASIHNNKSDINIYFFNACVHQ